MNAIELKKNLNILIEQKLPVFIWGSPGIGKSSIVKEIAKEKNLEFLDLRLSLLDPTDLKGIPFFDKDSNQAIWAPPNFLPHDKNSSGILFLDEINTAPPSVQAAAYQLILDRKVGDYKLPKNWAIVAAGNNEEDRGVVFKMPPPLLNRFIHLNLEVDFRSWKNWAYKSGIRSEIIAFLNYEEDALFNFNPNSEQKAFATPRSWEFANKILNSSKNIDIELLSGAIGKELAVKFYNFTKVTDKLPNINDILNAKKIEFENSPQVLFALISALVFKLKSATKKEIENAIKFSFNLPKEFAIMLIKDMQNSGIEFEDLEIWEEWVEEFSHLLEE
jgi:MoxR-like ATPase